MPVQLNDNGTLRSLRVIQVNDAGTLRNCYFVQLNDNGTLRNIPLAQLTLSGETITQDSIPAVSHAGVRVDADGNVYKVTGDGTTVAQIDSATDWIRPTTLAPGSYTVRATVNSGALAAGSAAADTDHALTSDREFYVHRELSGTSTANITLQIKLGSTVLAENTYALSCTTS